MPELWNDPISNPQAGMFSNFLTGTNNMMNNNGEMIAIALDKLGQGVAKNPAGGIGTLLGQGSLANKARIEQKNDQGNFMDKLISNLGGMTAPGMPGVNTIKTTTDADGNPEHTINFNPKSGSALGTTSTPTTIPQSTVGVQPITTPQPTVAPQTAINSLLGVYPF